MSAKKKKNVMLGNKPIEKKRKIVRKYVEDHGKGDILVEDFKKYRIKLKILCYRCGEVYQISWKNFLDDHRCRDCGQKQANLTNSIPFELTKKEIETKHPSVEVIKISDKDAANKKSCNVKLKIKCKKCNGIFRKSRFQMLHVISPCNKCATYRIGSSGEQNINKILKKFQEAGIIKWYKNHARLSDYYPDDPLCQHINELIFDYIISSTNGDTFVIEYDGGYHFTKKSHSTKRNAWKIQKYCDVKKNLHCKNNQIPLFRIHHKDDKYCEDYIIQMVLLVNKSVVDDSYIYYSDPDKYKAMIGRMERKEYQKTKIIR